MAQFVDASARNSEQYQSNQVVETEQSENPLVSSTFTGASNSEYLLTMQGKSTSTNYQELKNIANSEFEREMRTRFPQSTEEQLSLSSYENFNKIKIGERLIINQAGQEKYLELIGNSWQEIKMPEQIESLGKELKTLTTNDFNAILKSIFPSSNSETFEQFTNHNKFRLGYNLVIQAQDSNDFYQLSGKKWEKVEDPIMLEKLRGIETDNLSQRDNSQITEVALNGAINLGNKINNMLPNQGTNSVGALFKNALEETITPVFESQIALAERTDPMKAFDLMITGLKMKRELATTEIEKRGIDSEIETIEYYKDALELRFPHHQVEVQNSDPRSIPELLKDYENQIDETKRIYSKANVAALEEALSTGEINGKAVDRKAVEEHIQQAYVFKAFLEGKYDTNEGHPSVYGEGVLYSILTTEDSMKALGLKPAAYVSKDKRGPGEFSY